MIGGAVLPYSTDLVASQPVGWVLSLNRNSKSITHHKAIRIELFNTKIDLNTGGIIERL
jgi:hypothetical protein